MQLVACKMLLETTFCSEMRRVRGSGTYCNPVDAWQSAQGGPESSLSCAALCLVIEELGDDGRGGGGWREGELNLGGVLYAFCDFRVNVKTWCELSLATCLCIAMVT